MRILLAGIWCGGNVGDVASLSAIGHWLHERGHRVAVATAEVPWPEGLRRIVRAFRGDLVPFLARREAELADCLVIGGGDLGVGYAWHLIPFALHAGRRVVSIGMSFPHQWTGNGHPRAERLNRTVLRSFDWVAPRDNSGLARVEAMGARAVRGADAAFLLPRPEDPRGGGTVIWIREHPDMETQLQLGRTAVETARELGSRPLLAACSPGDRNVAERIAADWGLKPVCDCTADWRRALRVCARSALVVSIGRLHPLIFATHTGTPAVAAPLPCHHPPDKIGAFAADTPALLAKRDGESLRAAIRTAFNQREQLAEHMEAADHGESRRAREMMDLIA